MQVPGEGKQTQDNPFKHKTKVATYDYATPDLVAQAIQDALEAKKKWSRTSLQDRAAIFYRAAGLLQGPYKYRMMAATMLGQGKNAYQGDIDCVAEVPIEIIWLTSALSDDHLVH